MARNIWIPGGTAARIIDATSLLHGLAEGERPQLGRRVVVYGGGDTALDAARSARRLTGSEPVIVYRRMRERIPAHGEKTAGLYGLRRCRARADQQRTASHGGRLLDAKQLEHGRSNIRERAFPRDLEAAGGDDQRHRVH